MLNDLKKIIPAGFVFGLFFSILAFAGYFQLHGTIIWSIPIATSLLCALGAAVGAIVTKLLENRDMHPRVVHIAAFIAAALVNVSIVMLCMAWAGIAIPRETTVSIVLGLGAGAVYALYIYTTERMKERVAFLEALAENNRRLQESGRKLAIAEERNRMGRELHDSVSQGLHAIVYTIHSLRNELAAPSERVGAILNHVEATANSSLDELRTMIEELRPSLLTEHGLEEALRMTGDLFAGRTGVPLEFEYRVSPSYSPEFEMTVYRLVQEALANIERHASAQHVYLKLRTEQGKVLVIVRDDGVGFDTRAGHPGNGLRNMRQRVEEAGGIFTVISRLGLGTTITAEFPTKG